MKHTKRIRAKILYGLLLAWLGGWTWVWAMEFPGPVPGEAKGRLEGSLLVLENRVLAVHWDVSGGLKLAGVVDKLSGRDLEVGMAECFQIMVSESPMPTPRVIRASDLRITAAPKLSAVEPDGASTRIARQQGGQQLVVQLVDWDGNLEVEWRAELRDGSNYVRQEVRVKVKREELEIKEVVLLDLQAPGAQVYGKVDGSPVVAGNFFFGYEHPISKSQVLEVETGSKVLQRIRCSYPYLGLLNPGEVLAHSSVIGVVPEGQLRRGFLYYLERERAQPYRPFLHHNNGEDIGKGYYNLKKEDPEKAKHFRLNQEQMWREIIETVGQELIRGRGVVMDSFVHDYDWDDETQLWQFHEGYPRGFRPIRLLAEQYGVDVGIWLSPWGGYPARSERIEFGQKLGFETASKGLTLAGPRYYSRFRNACVGLLREYGMNYYKFDGFGAGNNKNGPEEFTSDVEALLRLIDELRELNPRVFVNPSTGSWPSPFWLLHADCIWRAGSDAGVFGKGSERQKWITYRDNATYHSALGRGPLYPLNSYMLHGIMINTAKRVKTFEIKDIIDEIRSFFGNGTNLQELYVAPSLMTPETWDILAEAANWSRQNADVLVDTHWVGGDPAKLEVYGWASWNKKKGTLTLRNPNDKKATIAVDIGVAFEIPEGTPQRYSLKSPWKEDAGAPMLELTAGQKQTIQLEPFQVLVFDAIPE